MTDGPNETEKAARSGWLRRLRDGLSRSTGALAEGLGSIFTKRRLDDDALDELEEVLIRADLGVRVAGRVRTAVSRGRFDREISAEEIREALAQELAVILAPLARPLDLGETGTTGPQVIVFVGVNGAGKTTTIGKLARRMTQQGKRVMIAAGDTFRAAAVEQLQVWGDRAGVPVVTGKLGGDAAGLAFGALERARAEGFDVLMIDTAGRLQNKEGLMSELAKIRRVLARLDPAAPHETLLVLDATTGQNALSQVEVFGDIAKVTGLVMTKLDGTARGGVLVAIAERFGLPIRMIGVGEGVEDLQDFDALAFARALAGSAARGEA
jgi:fused signal recognition particle receptor